MTRGNGREIAAGFPTALAGERINGQHPQYKVSDTDNPGVNPKVLTLEVGVDSILCAVHFMDEITDLSDTWQTC